MPIRVFEGDSIDVLRDVPDGTYTAVVTDPPYGLSAPPNPADVVVQWLLSGDFVRTGGRKKAPPPGLSELAARFAHTKGPAGFLGHSWDSFVPGPALWREVYRTCKPGAIALVFSSTRTYVWTVLAMLLAGFEQIDMIGWVQAGSMPHAGTLDKRIDERDGVVRPAIGPARREPRRGAHAVLNSSVAGFHGDRTPTAPGSELSAEWAGHSTTLCGAIEPIAVMRRPCEGTAVSNVLKHGCGAMNVAACGLVRDAPQDERRIADMGFGGGLSNAGRVFESTMDSRWPKNVLIDEAAADILDAMVGERASDSRREGARSGMGYRGAAGDGGPAIDGSVGGPSRFFWVGPCAQPDDLLLPVRYVPKVRYGQRVAGLPVGLECPHPTMKPIELMRWLCRLVGHPRGRILDPFLGSGSTLAAARLEGLPADGIEREADYARIARIRAGVARFADFRGLPPLNLPTDPRSALAEWYADT